MTIFENRIYRIILEYLWFNKNNKKYKSYARSLSSVNWYFHGVRESSLGVAKLNRCSLFDHHHLTKLHYNGCGFKSIKKQSLQLITPKLRALTCDHTELGFLLECGMSSLEQLKCLVTMGFDDTTKQLRGQIGMLASTLKAVSFQINMKLYYELQLLIIHFLSERFEHLTSIELIETSGNVLLCNLYRNSKMVFDRLLKFKSLQHLVIEFQIDKDKDNWDDEGVKSYEFQSDLLCYLMNQSSLKSFHHNRFLGSSIEEYLLQESSSIEYLSLDLHQGFSEVTRNNIKKLSLVAVSDQDMHKLAMVKYLKVHPKYPNSLAGITQFLNRQQQLQKQYGFPADRVLKCEVNIGQVNIEPEFLEALKNNTTLKRLYLSIKEDDYIVDLDDLKVIDSIIQSHPTIRNKDTWFITKQKLKDRGQVYNQIVN
ncbi:hypothetical protein PPL_02764 [Heterostelium album PN500]|uniref:Uncharacterized protein n=1 Tax=Heterostelium pallidum (strain ATCC 26659 / Pp 5 / PN500) TaxID=670386 RepID=D3B2Z9_HETP5|nr:hypothetical protein PPL_02764 [Heterostelium album PN500]EFA83697.1 hypothetical protein PPL_02764 [Heterostelium album PN500]|eukprot:XP_020435814.1 hypothetical protein PPL_02764 [Heterostelium album PN500]